MGNVRRAKYTVGQVVRHRVHPFRGIIFDVDPVFNNTEEWWKSIPAELRPKKDQPFYHLLAENAQTEYIAYVSEQNLLPDASGQPLRHPQVGEMFAVARRRQLSAAVPAAAALSNVRAKIAAGHLFGAGAGGALAGGAGCGAAPPFFASSCFLCSSASSYWRCAICCISARR